MLFLNLTLNTFQTHTLYTYQKIPTDGQFQLAIVKRYILCHPFHVLTNDHLCHLYNLHSKSHQNILKYKQSTYNKIKKPVWEFQTGLILTLLRERADCVRRSSLRRAKAEKEGFEPSVQLPVRMFSKHVLSATQASLRFFCIANLINF